MSLILRIDVDKPYGRHTIARKVFSKFKEDLYPGLPIRLGYLSHLKDFIRYCNDNGVIGNFYHRLCTSPDEETMMLLKGRHDIGLHLENSRTIETVAEELKALEKFTGKEITSFSKHGSGVYKLGKYHYPKYEPEKYKRWANELKVNFYSGNGIPGSLHDLFSSEKYFANVFWIEPYYRSATLNKIGPIVEAAVDNDIVLLIHPCNYIADNQTHSDFKDIVKLAAAHNVSWKLFCDL